MYAERFGSYSMAATLAGTPSFERLKSILRYRRLAPPPRWREVLRPRELRPPDFVSPSTSVFSGSSLVISEKSGYETKRRPALVGLGLRIGMRLALLEAGEALEDRDRVALAHLDDGLLPLARASRGPAAALGLGLHRHRAHLDHVDAEELLDGLADLRLVRLVVDAERVLVRRRQDVALLGDDRADDDLGGFHQSLPPAARAVSSFSASSEASTALARTRSATPTSEDGRTLTRSRLRNERATVACSSARTTRTPLGWPQSETRAAACLADGVSANGVGSSTASEPRPACSDRALRSAVRRSLRLTLKV